MDSFNDTKNHLIRQIHVFWSVASCPWGPGGPGPPQIYPKKTIYDETFQKAGFKQWHRSLEHNRGFAKHAMSQQYELNMASWQQFLQSEPIDAQINTERRRILELGSKERQSRYEVLPILLDVTNTLARLRLSFRGHDETDTFTNKGIVVEHNKIYFI